MALVAETLVEEWLNRKGYFTIRGAKTGQGEIDLLAISFREPDALHVEVSVSARAIGYISGPPIARKSPEALKASVEEWCVRKFHGKNAQIARRREELCPDHDWRYMLVYGDLKHPEELPLFEGQGVEVKHIRDDLDELRTLKDTRTSSEASGVAELLELCREEQGEALAKGPEAPESENDELYGLVEGGELKPGMLVLDIRGNAKNGSVPEGVGVVEEITKITPAAPGHNGQEYVKLHLKAVKDGTTRTKYLSKAKKVKAKAGGQYKGGKARLRIASTGGTATGKPSFSVNERSSEVQYGLKVRPGAVRSARMELWLSQEGLAEKSGVSVNTLGRLERKEPGRIRKATLLKLAEALEVEPERLARTNVVAP